MLLPTTSVRESTTISGSDVQNFLVSLVSVRQQINDTQPGVMIRHISVGTAYRDPIRDAWRVIVSYLRECKGFGDIDDIQSG